MNFGLREAILAFCGLIFFVAPSISAEGPFYQGKNVNFIINFAAGGPTDIEGRIVARHLAKHIPGYPTIIVPFGLAPNPPTPSFPDGFNAKPAPFGVSFTGMACSEPRLIELGYAFEQATKRRVPPLSAP